MDAAAGGPGSPGRRAPFPAHAARVFDVTAFGVRGDGRTLDTAAFNAAIEAASRSGGGTRAGARRPLSVLLHPAEKPHHDPARARCGDRGGGPGAARTPEEHASAYPEPSMFGTLPAWGLWIRHVRGIAL